MDRREFISNITRGSILGGIGLLVGTLLLKEKKVESCQYIYLCKGCKDQDFCQKEEAVKFRLDKTKIISR